MDITKKIDGTEMTIAIAGRLDTLTAPELEASIDESIEGVTKLYLDLNDMEYISSAGIRVILKAQKIMNTQGELIVKNVSHDEVMEVFEITGFLSILHIE